jgi:glycosyltransferase involved in cell wall biosynthesis
MHKHSAKVSLVIPVKNEAASIAALLSSIRKQTVPPAETLLVDGGSSDQTCKLIRETCRIDSRIRLLEARNATPGRGRNLGIDAARNEWIALTDAGITLAPDWLEHLMDKAQTPPRPDVVYGNYEPSGSGFFQRCAALVYVSPKRAIENGTMRGPAIASVLLRRRVWRAVGGFPDLRAAEDLIFMRRIEAGGFRIAWAPQATVWWQLRPDLLSTYNKFVLYSYHNVRAGQQRYWHYGLLRIYLLGVPFLLLAFVHHPWWLLGCVLGLAARVAKNIWIRREERSLTWLLNPMQFVGVAIIMLFVDVATFVGWGKAIWQTRKV